jgi:membrane-associated phospholipid phosphatase
MPRSSLRLVSRLLVVVFAAGCTRAPGTDPRMVSEWMHTLYGVVRAERVSPPVASRFMAYAAVGLYEGLAAVLPELPTLAGVLNGLETLPRAEDRADYDPTVVAVASKRVVLDSLLVHALPATRAAVGRLADSLLEDRAARGVRQAILARSEELGQRIGLAVVAWSRTDGFAETRGRPYTVPAGLGLWVNDTPEHLYATQMLSGATEFVGLDNPANILRPGEVSDRGLILSRPKPGDVLDLPPANMAGTTEPYWGEIRPFVLATWDECPVPEPPPFSTEPGSAFYEDARRVYETWRVLTPEQREIALYWADNPGETGTPPGHWLAIAGQMISQERLDGPRAARVLVATALAQADAFIACWGYKFLYNLIRPRTYIRMTLDPAWEPQIPTPPFPEYPSGHSTQSAAAATVLTGLIGGVPFVDSTSMAIGHGVRRFGSFMDAALEAGQSRIYGGIHFEFGNVGGRMLGECIGRRVLERQAEAAARAR